MNGLIDIEANSIRVPGTAVRPRSSRVPHGRGRLNFVRMAVALVAIAAAVAAASGSLGISTPILFSGVIPGEPDGTTTLQIFEP